MTYPINTWIAEGALVFRVGETGKYRFGEPETTNQFSMRVYPGVGQATEEDAEKLASKIAELLNKDGEKENMEDEYTTYNISLTLKVRSGYSPDQWVPGIIADNLEIGEELEDFAVTETKTS